MDPIFHRTRMLLGDSAMAALQQSRVIIFGVGGVGSWCAEALVRSGISHLTIVDSDLICITNVNRQIQATSLNPGRIKVEELGRRLREINPVADIRSVQKIYDEKTRDDFGLASYDYVIDAIDSLSNKAHLIAHAWSEGVTIFSAMGASLKIDPTKIRVSSIWKTQGCPLARKVRQRLRRMNAEGDLLCVYSEELRESYAGPSICGTKRCFCPENATEPSAMGAHEWCSSKAQINGSIAHMTGAFGMFLSGLVIQDIVAKTSVQSNPLAPPTGQPYRCA